MSAHHRYELLSGDESEVQPSSPASESSSLANVAVPDIPANLSSHGEVLEPPSYNVAVSLPTYDESLRAKRQEEQQQLCGHSPSGHSAPSQISHDARRQVNNNIGTDASFVIGFIFAFLFNWVGLVAAFCLMKSCAGRFGALTGLGLSLVKWVAIAKRNHWTVGVADEDSWVWWLLLSVGILISCSSTLQYLHVKYVSSRAHTTVSAAW